MYRLSNIICIISLLAFCGCNALNHAMSFKEQDINPGLFENIPDILLQQGKTKERVEAKDILCYKTSFKQSFVENGNVVDIALLNENSTIKPVDYIGLEGYDQDMYLFRLVMPDSLGKCDVFVYMAVKYGTGIEGNEVIKKYLSFPAVYLGEYAGDNLIRFYKSLKVSHNRNGYQLKLNGKRRLLYKTENDFYTKPNETISIKEIILDEHNKVGGSKPIIFPINELFSDISTIKLKYDKNCLNHP